MHDAIKVDEERGMMEMSSYGRSSRENIAAGIREALEICETRGITKLVADATHQESMPPAADIFELFSSFPAELKTAMLLKKKQRTEEDLMFVETIATNRGIPIKAFYDREQALRWLDED